MGKSITWRGGLPASVNPPPGPPSLAEDRNVISARPIEQLEAQVGGTTLLKPYNPRATHEVMPTKCWPEED